MREKTVRIWRQEFPVEEFCRLLGIPESEAPDLFMVYANPVGMSLKFLRRVSDTESLEWSHNWWSARRFCKQLGLPGAWGGHIVSTGPDCYGKTIELRFVS